MKTILYLGLLFAALATNPATAQKSSPDQKAVRLDSLFNTLFATNQFSGNVLIAENGGVLYRKSFGLSDIAHNVPLNDGTRFLLGSVSKQFTAAAIVKLKEKGKIGFDDLLQKYIPELPYKDITIRQLLQHTSGIPDTGPLMQEHWDKSRIATNSDMIAMLIEKNPPVFFPPGRHFLYSNTGYALLATIIERISKQTFADFMHDEVFAPLGMNETLIHMHRYNAKNKVPNLAIGYVYDEEMMKFVIPDEHPRWKQVLWEDGIYGEDGVNSTIDDMLRWNQVIYDRKFLTESDWQEVLTPGKPASGTSEYGMGWKILTPEQYGKIASHSGGWPGFIAYSEQQLDKNRTIVILRNKFTPQTKMPVDKIREILAN